MLQPQSLAKWSSYPPNRPPEFRLAVDLPGVVYIQNLKKLLGREGFAVARLRGQGVREFGVSGFSLGCSERFALHGQDITNRRNRPSMFNLTL